MKKWTSILLCLLFLTSLMIVPVLAQDEKEIKESFDNPGEVKLKLVLGDCEIIKSKDKRIHVRLVYAYDEDDDFEAIFREQTRRLILEEKFHSRHRNNGPEGYSHWTVAVPDDVEIDFNTATGDVSVNGVDLEMDGNTGTGDIEITEGKGLFDLNTGTGNIEIANSQGEYDVNSGTGRVEIKDSKGTFDGNSGTGRVTATNITIIDEAQFNSGTGDVIVKAPKGKDFDLSISSGTDDAVLDMDGQKIEGTFEMTCHARKGDISSPVKFDDEEEYWQGDERYFRKTFSKGSSGNRYYISTGTGRAKLKK